MYLRQNMNDCERTNTDRPGRMSSVAGMHTKAASSRKHVTICNALFLLFFSSFLMPVGELHAQGRPEHTDIDIYNIKHIKPYHYYATQVGVEDSVSAKWAIVRSSKDNLKNITESTFDKIIDFALMRGAGNVDSIAVVVARGYLWRSDSSARAPIVFISKVHLDNQQVDTVLLKDLHYYHFDDNGLIGVTDSVSSRLNTYYLDGRSGTVINQMDGSILNDFFLYPSKVSDNGRPYFILRNIRDSLFTVATLQRNQLHRLYDRFSTLSIQPNKTIIGKIGGEVKLYKPNAIPDLTQRGYREIANFPTNAKYTVGRESGTQAWWIIDENLNERKISIPDSLGTILSARVFPKGFPRNDFILVETIDGSKRKKFYAGPVNGDFSFWEDEQEGMQIAPFFDGFLLSQDNNGNVFIRNIESPMESKVLPMGSIRLDRMRFFKTYDPTTNSGTYLITAELKGDTSRSQAIVVQVSKLTNESNVFFEDTVATMGYYVSDTFLYYKRPGSRFWNVRNLRTHDLVLDEQDALIVVKPFIAVQTDDEPVKVEARAIKATGLAETQEIIFPKPQRR